MQASFTYDHRIGELSISLQELGSHLVVCISGGDAPHIGSVVLASPRPSLSGCATSATSSVLNRIGHKDETVAREVAEFLSSHLNTVVCCICGIHKDGASAEDIRACLSLGDELAQFLLSSIDPAASNEGVSDE